MGVGSKDKVVVVCVSSKLSASESPILLVLFLHVLQHVLFCLNGGAVQLWSILGVPPIQWHSIRLPGTLSFHQRSSRHWGDSWVASPDFRVIIGWTGGLANLENLGFGQHSISSYKLVITENTELLVLVSYLKLCNDVCYVGFLNFFGWSGFRTLTVDKVFSFLAFVRYSFPLCHSPGPTRAAGMWWFWLICILYASLSSMPDKSSGRAKQHEIQPADQPEIDWNAVDFRLNFSGRRLRCSRL
jgi:hypothetical protein